MEEKLVYLLSDGATTGAFLDFDSMVEELKGEFENDFSSKKFTIETKVMTDKEISQMGEFDGF